METWVELSPIVQNLGVAIAALVGSLLAWRNFSPTRSQAEAARTQAELARRVHVADLFERAVSHLADDKFEVRLGAIYTLRYIAEDYPDLARPVRDLLTAYVRESTGDYGDVTPPVDTQAIMDVLKTKVS